MRSQSAEKNAPRRGPRSPKVVEKLRGRVNRGLSAQVAKPDTAIEASAKPSASILHFAKRTDLAVIPWQNILGERDRPLGERTRRDGQGLVVLLGPLDNLILDLPDQLESLPEPPGRIPEPLVTLPAKAGREG
jgi:hypothetical protein